MNPAKFLKASLLVVAWLVFGGAYVLDALDASYEMNAPGTALEQALEPEDKARLNGHGISLASDITTTVLFQDFHTVTTAPPRAVLFSKPPIPPLYQLLSSYRI